VRTDVRSQNLQFHRLHYNLSFLKYLPWQEFSKKFGFSDRILCLRVDEQPSGFENTRVHVDSVTQFCCIDGGIQYSG